MTPLVLSHQEQEWPDFQLHMGKVGHLELVYEQRSIFLKRLNTAKSTGQSNPAALQAWPFSCRQGVVLPLQLDICAVKSPSILNCLSTICCSLSLRTKSPLKILPDSLINDCQNQEMIDLSVSWDH
jgi:hypothetical protein